MIPPRIVYETTYADQNFYSVEKAGFTNMSDLMVDALGILTNNGFTTSNVVIVDTTGNEIGDAGNTPAERILQINTGGMGYKIADTLELVPPDDIIADQNLLVGHTYKILSVSTTGGATDFMAFGSADNMVDTIFTVSFPGASFNDRVGSGTGTVKPLDLIPPQFNVDAVNSVGAVTAISIKSGKVNDWYRINTSLGVSLRYPNKDLQNTASGKAQTYLSAGTYRGVAASALKPAAFLADDTPFDIATVDWAAATASGPPTISVFGAGSNPRPREAWRATNGYEAAGKNLWPRGVEMDSSKVADYGIKYEAASAGIWFSTADYATLRKTILVGQEILLDPDTPANHNNRSFIPPGTTVTGVFPFDVVGGIRPRAELTVTGATPVTYNSEKTIQYTYITVTLAPNVSGELNINLGDAIWFRGQGLTVDDVTKNPAGFTAILEAGGQVDPLNDGVGVFGEVVTTTTDSYYVELQNLTDSYTAATVKLPKIYIGQTLKMPAGTVGSIDPAALLIVSDIVEEGFDLFGPNTNWCANIKLDEQYSLANQETLNCVFTELQPYRIAFEVLKNTNTALTTDALKAKAGAQAMNCYAGTPLQLTGLGAIANVTDSQGLIKDRAGMMGEVPTGALATLAPGVQGYAAHGPTPIVKPDPLIPTQGFVNRELRVAGSPESYPLNYTLTITNRGIFFGVWEGNWSNMQKPAAISITDKDSFFNWFLIQRPVDRENGRTLCKGRAPVFCVNSVGYKYWKFVVREEDIMHPQQGDPWNVRDYIDPRSGTGYIGSAGIGAANAVTSATPTAVTVGKTIILQQIASKYRIPADTHTQDSYAIMNTTNQISLTEYNTYLISFLHNLTTPRFRYSEELDLIGQASADVCMSGNDVVLTAPGGGGVYGEPTARTYRAMPSNLPYNTGLRVCVLRDIPH